MQMIDEITTLDVSEIVVVSIIGRLNDHKKDFFSRLNTMTGNNGIIPVSVYFGVQWHIPTYYIEESPIIREKQWLETLISIANLPDKIQRTANNILEELKLKTIEDESNKYLLKRKDGKSIIKELILVKEEIGKITSYRYYKEYFIYFDKFMKIYEGEEKSEDRYQMIEAICAVFLHEPNLFQKVKNILPDLAEKIEVFIQTILFGNPEKRKRPKLLKNDLFYKWTNKNIIHLFFIVHNGGSLLDQLSNDKIIELIKNFASHSSDLDYLFYRILKFIPISQNEVQNKPYAGKIKLLVEILKESPQLDLEIKKQIKRYSIFFESLPNSELDFDEHLAYIKRQYSKIGDDKHHNVFIINDKILISSQIWVYTKLKSNNESVEEPFNTIRKHWENISIFISNLLGFYKTNVQFFTFHDFVNDGPNEKRSLEKMFGIIDKSIHSEELTNGDEVLLLLNEIFERFILENSETYKLFENISVQDAPREFSVFLETLRNSYPNHNIKVISPPQPIKLNIPLLYFNGIILKELLSNFRHSDENYPIEINWEYDENFAVFEIKNHIKKESLKVEVKVSLSLIL
ncbi:hypothetical protein L950_0222715 [Sphingobacterium sp. IITKGP-BTPF85]|nr:hypothetical protein L950_0222715 [Sphingobacterium sp. IITKGP-BTPF85]